MMLSLYHYITESTKRTAVGLIVLSTLAFIGLRVASAAVSYDVTNNPQAFLSTSITSSQTTSIQLAALTRNGATVTFPTTSGGVLRLRSGSKVEDIYYTSATVNQTTKITTLVGVTRDVCWNIFFTHTACGGGQSFPKGTVVELTVDARLLNAKMNKDRANLLTASGVINFSSNGSGSLRQPPYTSIAERDRQRANPEFGDAACVTATGQCYDYLNGAWRSRSGSNVINAGLDVAGKVEIANLTEMKNRTMTGATNALVVLSPRYITASGGLQFADFVPRLDIRGFMSGSILGTSVTAAKFLRGDQTWQTIIPGSGSNLRVISVAQNGTAARTHSTTFVDIGTGAVTASLTNMTVGDLIRVDFMGIIESPTSSATLCSFDVRVNGGRIGALDGGANGLTNGLFTEQLGSTDAADEGVSFSIIHKVATGGTLTVRPQWRSNATGQECQLEPNYPYYFYVQVIE